MTRLIAVAVAALALPASISAGMPITVFAAASLTDVFPRIAASPIYSFAGSDQLALQIRQGAPADVYAAASPKYTQLLYRDGFVLKPVVFATNKLIILVPRSNAANINTVYDLRREGIKLVIGDRTVPIGTYTRQILDTLGITADVMKNVVSQETDVREVLAKVALGEADAGFVYSTDARTVPHKVRTIRIPARGQPNVRYGICVVSASSHKPAARAFVKRVLGNAGQRILRSHGFLRR